MTLTFDLLISRCHRVATRGLDAEFGVTFYGPTLELQFANMLQIDGCAQTLRRPQTGKAA